MGEVNLAAPMGWQLLCYVLAAGVLVALGFLAFAQYTRVETVPGVILSEQGIGAVSAEQRGIVAAIFVSPGDVVRPGQPLARISTARTLSDGQLAGDQISASLSEQESGVVRESLAQRQAADADRARLNAQVSGLRAEIASINQQIDIQQQLVLTAGQDLENARRVAERGFISRSDILAREEALLLRQQSLAQLQQSAASKRASLSDSVGSAAQASAQVAVTLAALDGRRAEIARQRTDASLASGFVITAPGDGVVTQISAKAGQVVEPGQLVLSLVPRRPALRAELRIPVQSIGFLVPGQRVRLSLDAFPYQQYGTVSARIVTISQTTVEPSATAAGGRDRAASDGADAYYPAIAVIDQPSRVVAGRRLRLLSGMTLSARVATRQQSLLAWFVEPLVAVQRR